MDDYDGLHATYYDETDGRSRTDVGFCVRVAKFGAGAGSFLEVGSGTGRVLLPIAERT